MLGNQPTIALAAPFGWISPEALSKAGDRAPVIQHQLGNAAARQKVGPRELREDTLEALEKAGWNRPWGLAATCRSIEDAATFAIGGFTWLTLDLAPFMEPRAASMSLEELDAAIVSLEDQGAFAPGWHEPYLAGEDGLTFEDETLARVAVHYGAALIEAEQMLQAVRSCFSDRGDLPDLEISIARASTATSPQELAFLSCECIKRGLIHNGATRFAPSFAPALQPGFQTLPESFVAPEWHLPPAAVLSVPAILSIPTAHLDATDSAILAGFRRMASADPRMFRNWLVAARNAFPTARAGWNLSTSEDDVRFLPEVPDEALESTFLDTLQGRQLLLVTFQNVMDATQA